MSAVGNYALIKNKTIYVENIIVANDDFYLEGYYTIRYGAEVFCEIGMYYNKNSNLFYDDPEFTAINGKKIKASE